METNGVLEIEKLFEGGICILKIKGVLIKNNIQQFTMVLEACLKKMEPVVIDFSGVDFIDPFGVAILFEKYQWSLITEQKLTLKGMKPEIKESLELVSLDSWFNIDDTRTKKLRLKKGCLWTTNKYEEI